MCLVSGNNMALSTKAAAFSIDALLSRQNAPESDQTNSAVGSISSRNPCPILDAALSKPKKEDNSKDSSQIAPHDVSTSAILPPHDFASSFASIENRLRQISVQSPALPNYPACGGVDLVSSSPCSAKKVAKLEHPLTIPSFKIHSGSICGENLPSSDTKGDVTRRLSAHSTTSTEKAGIEEALACLKHNAALGIADKPLAVEQWVRSTLEYTSKDTGHQLPGESAPVFQTVDGIKVTLVNADLWKKFNNCGTEMILNRAGR